MSIKHPSMRSPRSYFLSFMSNSLVQSIQVCLIVGWLLLAVGLQHIPVEIRAKLIVDTLSGLFIRKVSQLPGGGGERPVQVSITWHHLLPYYSLNLS